MTTLVVPSPISESCLCANYTKTFAAGFFTSNCFNMVAPSLEIVTYPISSTSILSSP